MAGRDLEESFRLDDDDEEDEEPSPEIRMVLLGSPGVGKSSSGNTILGRRVFRSAASPSAVTSTCERERGHFLSQQLLLVDTPGSLDASSQEADHCVRLAAPGPHVFLLVLEPRRFTEEDKIRAESLLRAFGEEAFHYAMVLFTHGDQLRAQGVSMQTFISQSVALRGLVRKCGGRSHVLNNMSTSRAQIRNLLRKIRWMMQSNGGAFSISSIPRRDGIVSTTPDEEEDRKQVREVAPVYNIHLTKVVHIHNHRPAGRDRTSMPWSALGAVLGMPFGPAGVATGAALGNAMALLED